MIDPDTGGREEKKRHEETGGALEFEKAPKFTRLWTVEAATGALRPVTPGDVQVWEFAWSPAWRVPRPEAGRVPAVWDNAV